MVAATLLYDELQYNVTLVEVSDREFEDNLAWGSLLFQNGTVHADVENWQGLVSTDLEETTSDKMLAWVNASLIEPPRPIGYGGLFGLYVLPSTLRNDALRMADFYKAYQVADVARLRAAGMAGMNPAGLRAALGNEFPACNATKFAWCGTGDFEGYFVPPWCRADPASCVEVWMGLPGSADFYFERAALELQLYLVFAYHTPAALESRRRDLALSNSPPNAVFFRVAPTWGAEDQGSSRIYFPDGPRACKADANVTVTNPFPGAPCDELREIPLAKLVSPRLRTLAPEAFYTLKLLNFTRENVNEMLQQLGPSFTDTDVRTRTCSYLRARYSSSPRGPTFAPACAITPPDMGAVFDPDTGVCKGISNAYTYRCFSDDERPAQADRSNTVVRVGVKNWDSHKLAGKAMAILLQEYLGYTVTFVDITAIASDNWGALVGEAGAADVDPENWHLGDQPIFKYVRVRQEVEMPDTLGYTGRVGLYALSPDSERPAGSDWYRFYQGRTARDAGFVAPNRSFMNQSASPCVTANIEHCNKGDWKGFYVPPQCENRVQDCVEAMMVTPRWDQGLFEQLVRNNNLNVVLAYYGDEQTAFEKASERYLRKQKVLIYFWYPLAAEGEIQVSADARVAFPTYYEGCEGPVSLVTGARTCDVLETTIIKVWRRSLWRTAPEAAYMIRKFKMTLDAINGLLARIKRTQSTVIGADPNASSSNVSEYEAATDEAACFWVKSNKKAVKLAAPDCISNPIAPSKIVIGSYVWMPRRSPPSCIYITCPPNEFLVIAPGEGQDPFCKRCNEGIGRENYVPKKGQLDCVPCLPGQEPINSSRCEPCPPGKFSSPEENVGHCLSCKEGSYAPVAGLTACAVCPPGGYCAAGARGFTAVPQFYVNGGQEDIERAFSERFVYKNGSDTDFVDRFSGFDRIGPFQCPVPSSCLGENQCYVDSQGRTTMEGPFCGSCKLGFQRRQSLEPCGPCPSGAQNTFLMFLCLLGLAVLGITMDRLNASKVGNVGEVSSVVPKIATNFFTLFSVVASNIHMEVLLAKIAEDGWAASTATAHVSAALGIGRTLENPTKVLVSMECFLEGTHGFWIAEHANILLAWFAIPMLLASVFAILATANACATWIGQRVPDSWKRRSQTLSRSGTMFGSATPVSGGTGLQDHSSRSSTAFRAGSTVGGKTWTPKHRESRAKRFAMQMDLDALDQEELQKTWTGRLRLYLERFKPVAVVLIYFMHPMVTSSFLKVFVCKNSDEHTGLKYDSWRLVSNMEVDCFASGHIGWQVFAGLGMLFWSLGIPAYFWFVLWQAQRPNVGDGLHAKHVLRTYGFLYDGFLPNCYHQEMIYMLRKVFFLVGSTLPWLSADARTVLLLAMSCVYLAMHLHTQPFDKRAYSGLDRLETTGSYTLVAFLLARLFQIVLQSSGADEKVARLPYLPAFFTIMWFILKCSYLWVRTVIWPLDGPPIWPINMIPMARRLRMTLVPPEEDFIQGETMKAIEHVVLSPRLKGIGHDEGYLVKAPKGVQEDEVQMLKVLCSEAIEVLVMRHELCIGHSLRLICLPTFLVQLERILVGCMVQAVRMRLKRHQLAKERDTYWKWLQGYGRDLLEHISELVKGKTSEAEEPPEAQDVMGNIEAVQHPLSTEEIYAALMSLKPRLLDQNWNLDGNPLQDLCDKSKVLLEMLADVTKIFDSEAHFTRLRLQRMDDDSFFAGSSRSQPSQASASSQRPDAADSAHVLVDCERPTAKDEDEMVHGEATAASSSSPSHKRKGRKDASEASQSGGGRRSLSQRFLEPLPIGRGALWPAAATEEMELTARIQVVAASAQERAVPRPEAHIAPSHVPDAASMDEVEEASPTSPEVAHGAAGATLPEASSSRSMPSTSGPPAHPEPPRARPPPSLSSPPAPAPARPSPSLSSPRGPPPSGTTPTTGAPSPPSPAPSRPSGPSAPAQSGTSPSPSQSGTSPGGPSPAGPSRSASSDRSAGRLSPALRGPAGGLAGQEPTLLGLPVETDSTSAVLQGHRSDPDHSPYGDRE